jgi:hypothetical protein
MNSAFKHVGQPSLVIDKICYDKLSYKNKEFFASTKDRPLYKFLEEKNERMSFTPISR